MFERLESAYPLAVRCAKCAGREVCRRDRGLRLGTKGQKRKEDANPPLLIVYARRATIRGRRGGLLEGMTAARLEPYRVESTEWW